MHLKFAIVGVERIWSAYKKVCWLYTVRRRAHTDITHHVNQAAYHCQM